MRRIAWLILMLIGSLPGCGTTHSGVSPQQESWRRPLLANDSESLVIYYEWAHRLSADRFAVEYDTVRRSFAGSSSDFDRVRCAILLAVPGTAISDLPQALELLEPIMKNPDAPLHSVVFLLQAQFSDQRRSNEMRRKLDALKSLEKDMSGHGEGAK
ncbi:MAG TPA: hypothetical protein VMT94_01260 [Burkholderiales bacterium]|nr:hypothetical protein [Burkholderiales bacterium]